MQRELRRVAAQCAVESVRLQNRAVVLEVRQYTEQGPARDAIRHAMRHPRVMRHAKRHVMRHAMQVKQDIDQRVGRDLSDKFKHVPRATAEEVQALSEALNLRLATMPNDGRRDRFDWYAT